MTLYRGSAKIRFVTKLMTPEINHFESKIDKNSLKYDLIPLNLVYDYPVRWSKFKVLRDFVQNFYDAVGWKKWKSHFSCEIIDGSLYMTTRNTGFSYDWLLYIGASTKRDSDKNYAGYFGEGFKIASLCAVRDHGWKVELTSRNWKLFVVSDDMVIDGNYKKSLAYRICHLSEEIEDTILCISPFNEKELLQTVLMTFFYPENPLFGDKIWESDDTAVYHRSAQMKPMNYPSTFNASGTGIIFTGYQALGSFSHPLIFCLHNYRTSDRERNSFYYMDVIKIIKNTVYRLSPEASAVVLSVLKKRWYERPKGKYDFCCWYDIIRILVGNIADSTKQKLIWQQEYPHLLAAPIVNRKDIPIYNRRRQALAWLRRSGLKYQLVQEAFIQLGYPSIEEKCEEHDGFSITRMPKGDEIRRIKLLEMLALTILNDLFEIIKMPPCYIIKSEGSAWQGMTRCISIKNKSLSYRGLKIRFSIPFIALKDYLLRTDEFGNTFSTYLHELAHIFGSDNSASFSRAISYFMESILKNTGLIADFQTRWEG